MLYNMYDKLVLGAASLNLLQSSWHQSKPKTFRPEVLSLKLRRRLVDPAKNPVKPLQNVEQPYNTLPHNTPNELGSLSGTAPLVSLKCISIVFYLLGLLGALGLGAASAMK